MSGPISSAFVVPGCNLARAAGVILEEFGLLPTSTPRHAEVLVLVGRIPEALRQQVIAVYAQMPRPRAILALSSAPLEGLPAPDASASFDGDSIRQAHMRLRDALHRQLRGERPPPFRAPSLEPPSEGDHGGGEEGGGMSMSMAEMTAGLPRDHDGLPMERLELSFGPFFPGTPGGIALTFLLDGDVVAEAKTEPPRLASRLLEQAHDAPAHRLPGLLEQLDPLLPRTYRILAQCALEAAAKVEPGPALQRSRVRAVELERVTTHLSGTIELADHLGLTPLARSGERVHRRALALHQAHESDAASDIRGWLAKLRRAMGLRKRLRGVGVIGPEARASVGPVRRAQGIAEDVRNTDPLSQALGFVPITRSDGDAWARLEVRMAEVDQSLRLIEGIAPAAPRGPLVPETFSGNAEVNIETPRGQALLGVEISSGVLASVRLATPSTAHLALVPSLCSGLELSDALLALHSLDLSLWEVST